MTPPEIHIGTSSFSEPDWIGPFYPSSTKPADFFMYYATKFPTVEIDASYYAVPSIRTVERWRDLSPEGFTVAAKFPRSIVHGGEAATPDPAVILDPSKTYPIRDKFLDVMSKLGEHLGPLVLQFPYFNKTIFSRPEPFFERLNRFLSDLPKQYRYAVEIRNAYWISQSYADLLRAHNVAMVLVDQEWMPSITEVMQRCNPITTDFTYIRLLGERKRIEAITSTWEKEVIDRSVNLEVWVEFLTKLLPVYVKALVYINNHYAGHAPATARKLESLLQEKLPLGG